MRSLIAWKRAALPLRFVTIAAIAQGQRSRTPSARSFRLNLPEYRPPRLARELASSPT